MQKIKLNKNVKQEWEEKKTLRMEAERNDPPER